MVRGAFVAVRAWIVETAAWIPASVIAALMLPMAVTARSFGPDWTLHLWAIRQQQLDIEANGHPGLFLSAKPLGAFYPMFAFVGSGIYSVGGYLAIVLGDRPVLAYKLLFLVGLCFACAGMTWLSRQVGLRGWRSQIAGVVFVTGAYFVSDMVGRGDFAEFMALAIIPFLLAAGRAAFTARALRAHHVLALAVAAFVFSGSHNITLLWGSVFIVLMGLVLLFAFASSALPSPPWKRLVGVLGAAAIGVGLNAWFLFPDFAYGLDTETGAKNASLGLSKAARVQPGLLLNPLRTSPLEHSPFNRDLRVTLPWMFFAWALVAGVVAWRSRDVVAKRLFAGLNVLAALYLGLMLSGRPWDFMPHVLYNLQFRWRLQGYELLTTAILVMVVLTWSANDRRRRATHALTASLVVIVVFNVGMATWQVWRVRSEYVEFVSHRLAGREVPTGSSFLSTVVTDRSVIPVSWYGLDDFRDFSTRVVATAPNRTLEVPEAAVHGSQFAGVLDVPDGPAPFATNISAGPRFVRMTGITAVGRTNDGLIVAVRARGVPPRGSLPVTIAPAESPLLRAGTLVSQASLVAFAGLLLWLALAVPLRRRRVRRKPAVIDTPPEWRPNAARVEEPVSV